MEIELRENLSWTPIPTAIGSEKLESDEGAGGCNMAQRSFQVSPIRAFFQTFPALGSIVRGVGACSDKRRSENEIQTI